MLERQLAFYNLVKHVLYKRGAWMWVINFISEIYEFKFIHSGIYI